MLAESRDQTSHLIHVIILKSAFNQWERDAAFPPEMIDLLLMKVYEKSKDSRGCSVDS